MLVPVVHSEQSKSLPRYAIQLLGFSALVCNHLAKIARTFSGLKGRYDIQVSHIAKAVLYRILGH